MERRNFIKLSGLAALGLSLSSTGLFSACSHEASHSEAYKQLLSGLLKEWCDGLLKVQIIKPSDPTVHGMLACPSCNHIHGRVMDAVYPLLYMAKTTGEKKYLEAGIAVFEWGQNVTREDGAWTNDLDPKSWDGITVFGAISLAEALQYHGDLLDEERRQRWFKRLESAAAFVYQRFPVIGNANINYGATTIYALNLFGRILNKPEYLSRSKEMAVQIKSHFTATNTFLFGEIQGNRRRQSVKGLQGIDMGYNVEESLNTLVLYALQEKDEELLLLLEKALNTHLEFINPDGGLDNSFGNRIYKWSYWGSRTSDGMQQAFGMMANYNPAFGTAAFKNAELLKRCTKDGLLHGGLHYVSHDIKPCVHHTFAHVKPLAAMLDHWAHLPEINKTTPLPREIADGVKYYKEIDTSLFARGDWRGTVTAYDAEYEPKNDCRQATGGALSLLYNNKVGLLCTASMAVYKLQEANNQQPAPGEDIALTPRVETYQEGTWYTNLFDLTATVDYSDRNNEIVHSTDVQLKSESRDVVPKTASDFNIKYICTEQTMKIIASTDQDITKTTAFVLPIVSPTGEIVEQVSSSEIRITKPEGVVIISSNVPMHIKETAKSRTFNMVPGVEAIPIVAHFVEGQDPVELSIEII